MWRTRQSIACGPDPEQYLTVIKSYADAGADVLHLAQIGPDQEGFFEFFNAKVRPQLDAWAATVPRSLLLEVLDAPSEWQCLDPIARRVKQVVDAALRPQAVRNVLHGKGIGHPTHPPLAQAALGGWSGAAVIGAAELIGGSARDDTAARERGLLGLVGLATAAPAVVAGLGDWSELHEDQQRTGLVHSAVMSTARR